MKGDPQVIDGLNRVLTNELTAINQYFLHARILRHWGFERLAKHVYEESIGEMRHADWLTNRILFLDGLPNYQDLHHLRIGENVPEMFDADLALEQKNRDDLRAVMAQCEQVQDFVTKDILLKILDDTEEHIDWIETQKDLVANIGLQNYLQTMMGDGEPKKD